MLMNKAKPMMIHDYAGETKGARCIMETVSVIMKNKKGPVVHIYKGSFHYAMTSQSSPAVLKSSEKPEGMVIPIPEFEVFLCGWGATLVCEVGATVLVLVTTTVELAWVVDADEAWVEEALDCVVELLIEAVEEAVDDEIEGVVGAAAW
jgi:hypothetical protein